MRVNKIQALILSSCGFLLLLIIFFPSWQQAAERELSYRKDLGHGLLWKPPAPVAVDCYFVGCLSAPSSYFHVLLNKKLLLQQSLTVLSVAVVLLWLYRRRADGRVANLRETATRFATSTLLALLIPPGGQAPFGAGIVAIPRLLIRGGDFVLIPSLMIIFMFFGCVLVIFGLITAALWLHDGRVGRMAESRIL